MKPSQASSFLLKLLAICTLCLSALQPALTQTIPPFTVEPAPAHVVPIAPMPSWFTNGQPTEDAWVALDVLVNAASQGLNPDDYRAQELTLAFEFEHEQDARSAVDNHAQMDADLTAALERYLTDLNHGRLSPEVLKHRFKAPANQHFDAHSYLLQARQSGDLNRRSARLSLKFPCMKRSERR